MEDDQHQFVHAKLTVHSQYDRDRLEFELTMRQEPRQARLCGVGADRRPIDPPPIVQLRVLDPSTRRPQSSSSRTSAADSASPLSVQIFLQNPYYFMFASLAKPDEDIELHWLQDGKTECITGSVVSSLYHIQDSENNNCDAGFFVFPDLSVRTAGSYRLKLSLYEVVVNSVYHCKSIFSAPFYVYTVKKFPGMKESTPLSCSLADQGIKIRIRKDIRGRKRPVAALDTPVAMPIPQGAFGPVPVPLDDDEPGDQEKDREERERERDRDSDRDKNRERERWESASSVSSSAGGILSRRESKDGRGVKRSRGDDFVVEEAGPSNNNVNWGTIDPTLGAPQQSAPAQPPSHPAVPIEHSHYTAPHSAPAPHDHRYSAPASLASAYHYHPHTQSAPHPPSHHAPHYSVPPPAPHHADPPPPPHGPYQPYGPSNATPAPAPATATPTQSWGPPQAYEPYPCRYPLPPWYDYGGYASAPPPAQQQQPGGYGGYHEHHQHSHQAVHTSHHPGYATHPSSRPSATAQFPYASEYPSPGGSAHPAVDVGYTREYAPIPPYPAYGNSSAQPQSPQAQGSRGNAPMAPPQGGHTHYQLSTPPHQVSQGDSGYPPPPPASSGAPTLYAEYGRYPAQTQGAPANGSSGGLTRIRLAPLRVGGGSCPPGSSRFAGGGGESIVGAQGIGKKKNPLSIENIITEDWT